MHINEINTSLNFSHRWLFCIFDGLVIHRCTSRKPQRTVPFPVIFARKAAHRTGKLMSQWPSVCCWLEHLGNLFVIDFFPCSISRAHPNSGCYCDLSRTLPLPIISTVMLHLPLFTRLSFSVLHCLVSAEWVLPPPPPHPSMAYLSMCMTVSKLGHCVWRFSILERQNDNDERGVLFE